MEFYKNNTHDFNLFPTLVSVYDSIFLDDVQKIYPIIKQTVHDGGVEYCNLQQGGPSVTSYPMGSFFDKLPDEIQVPLLQKIQYCLLDYATKLGESNFRVTNSWFNIQYECSALHEHVHPGSIVSGALYVNVDEGSSSLRFKNINPYAHFSEHVTLTDYNCDYEEFEPKNGTLVLFPSWLPHYSLPNTSKERVVISFNTSFTKNI